MPTVEAVVAQGEEVQKQWEEFCYDLNVNDLISKYMMNQMLEMSAEKVGESQLLEHKWYVKIRGMVSDNWDVIPYPRQKEVTDILIVRDDLSVNFVSMKSAMPTEHSFWRLKKSSLEEGRVGTKSCNFVKAWRDEFVLTMSAKELLRPLGLGCCIRRSVFCSGQNLG